MLVNSHRGEHFLKISVLLLYGIFTCSMICFSEQVYYAGLDGSGMQFVTCMSSHSITSSVTR